VEEETMKFQMTVVVMEMTAVTQKFRLMMKEMMVTTVETAMVEMKDNIILWPHY
jgi:hypothetical protein